MFRFCCFIVFCLTFFHSPTAVDSAFKPWLNEDVVFLVDVCCLTDLQFQSLKSELISAMNVFESIIHDVFTKSGVYLYNNSRPETGLVNPTFPIVNISFVNVKSFQNAIRETMTQQENMKSTNTAKAIEHVSKLFSSSSKVRVTRKSLVVITTGISDLNSLLHESYNFTQNRNITVYTVGVGSNVNQQGLSILANGGKNSERVYLSPEFNCSTCELVKDLKVHFNNTPLEPDWCSVHNCHPNADCEWRWPHCECKDGFEGNGTFCTRVYLQEFYQRLDPSVAITSSEYQSLLFHLRSIFNPPWIEDPNRTYRGIHVVDFRNNILRYYVQFLGRFETTDVLLQRYVKDKRKYFMSESYLKADNDLGLQMPIPLGCPSSMYFANTQVNTASFSWYSCPQGFPKSSIHCIPYNHSTSQGLVLGGRFEQSTINTVLCNASLSQIDTTNMDLDKMVNASGQLMLLTAGHKLDDSEIEQALNIIDSIETTAKSLSLKISSHLLANMVVAISQTLAGLNESPKYNKDFTLKHKVVESLNFLAHSLNMSENGTNVFNFETKDLTIKIQDIGKSNTDQTVLLLPRKLIHNYNETLFPLNSSIVTQNLGTKKVRTVLIYTNSTTLNQPELYKHGMVSASISDGAKVKHSSQNVTVDMFTGETFYEKVNSTTFPAANIRHQCVTWDSKISDWSGENCCLDNKMYPSTVCKCNAGIVSMRTTISKTAPIVTHSQVTIIIGSIFSGVLYFLFFVINCVKISKAADPFYYHRVLCLTMATTYILFMFALPCRTPDSIYMEYGFGLKVPSWEDSTGYTHTGLLHFAVLASFMLLASNCYTMYRQTLKIKMYVACEVLILLVVCFIAASAVVFDAALSIMYFDKQMQNKDFCDPNDWRFITSSYLADNMCWISGKPFYTGSFICLLIAVMAWQTALVLCIFKFKKVKPYDAAKPERQDILFALILSALFGVCCTFAQLMIGSLEASTRQAMEICFAISTCVLMLGVVYIMCILPRRKAKKEIFTPKNVAMDGLHSTRLMETNNQPVLN